MQVAVIAVAMGLGLVVFVAMFIHWQRIGRAWRGGLEQVARKYRLRLHRPKGLLSALYDSAEGDFRGRFLAVRMDEESRIGSDTTTRYMVIEVSASGSDLRLGRPGSFDDGFTDFGESAGAGPVNTGDTAFDKAVELRGAPPSLRRRLVSDGALRERLRALVERGISFDGGTTKLRARTFPRTPEALLQEVDTVVAIADELAALGRG